MSDLIQLGLALACAAAGMKLGAVLMRVHLVGQVQKAIADGRLTVNHPAHVSRETSPKETP